MTSSELHALLLCLELNFCSCSNSGCQGTYLPAVSTSVKLTEPLAGYGQLVNPKQQLPTFLQWSHLVWETYSCYHSLKKDFCESLTVSWKGFLIPHLTWKHSPLFCFMCWLITENQIKHCPFQIRVGIFPRSERHCPTGGCQCISCRWLWLCFLFSSIVSV